MRYLKLVVVVIIMSILCSCSLLEGVMDHSVPVETEAYVTETQAITETLPAAEEIVGEQFEKAIEGEKVPNLGAVIKNALTENPQADIAAVVQKVLESGNYDMTDVPDTDGNDGAAMDALEVQLAEVLDSVLANIEVESVSTPWGVLGK